LLFIEEEKWVSHKFMDACVKEEKIDRSYLLQATKERRVVFEKVNRRFPKKKKIRIAAAPDYIVLTSSLIIDPRSLKKKEKNDFHSIFYLFLLHP